MNGGAVLFALGSLLFILGLAIFAPLAVAIAYDSQSPYESAEITAFIITLLVALVGGTVLRLFFSKDANRIRVREGFAIVTFSWLILSAVGMLPYLLSGVTHSIADAFFETMSGFTTTGASVFPEVEILPHGVMFWRCMTQWLGGMGVVVLAVALLPMMGVGGYRLMKAESPGGVAYERDRPRITESAKELWKIYLLFSLVLFALLYLSGMNFYDSLCHTFTTMSTGGFSTHTESVKYFQSPITQWIIIAFMFIAGVNFSVHAAGLRRNFRPFLRNREFRGYVIITLVCTSVGILVLSGGRIAAINESLVRVAAFQVLSVSTTTGFATDDFSLWPPILRLMLFLLMFCGACMGSTAGGIKVFRLLIYIKAVYREFHRMIFPHAIRPVRIGERVIEPAVVANILAFGLLYMVCFTVGAIVMTAYGFGMVTSMSASAAALGNIGPGLDLVGPAANWQHLPALAKWVMSFLMLLGRLELFSVLVLCTPGAWKR
ncbi:MAG: TrkH family potassium uptake protein [Myxococcota bacterium]